jgi:putative spermidine/putrescine transport system ATP-binding protein
MDGAFLEVEQVSVGYGTTPVLHGVSLAMGKGELVALLGSSGCGKTTLLRTIAGFIRPGEGRLRVAGRDITALPPDRRGMAMVFQSYALWPHMSVRANIGYGLKLRRVPRAEIARKVDGLLAMLGLEGLGERGVTALSGGQRQRVALGRALAIDPHILLLDEPLSNLDARIRQSVRHEIRALQRRLGITAIHVTHDREEAMVMADRIVILNGGRIEQEGPPEAIYNRPATPFVADFMGADNTLEVEGVVAGEEIVLPAGPDHAPARLPLEAAAWSRPPVRGRGTRFRVHFRSEAAELVDGGGARGGEPSRGAILLAGRIAQVSYPGGIWRHAVEVGSRQFLVDAPQAHEPGTAVRVRLPAAAIFLFPIGGETRLPETGTPAQPEPLAQAQEAH